MTTLLTISTNPSKTKQAINADMERTEFAYPRFRHPQHGYKISSASGVSEAILSARPILAEQVPALPQAARARAMPPIRTAGPVSLNVAALPHGATLVVRSGRALTRLQLVPEI